MRNLLVSSLVSSCLLGAAACGDGGVYSPSDPADFDHRMVDPTVVGALPLAERAYVTGHAIGVYLLGKTVPDHVAWKRYYYRPGMSSARAEFGYAWEEVLVARSGGSDGSGGAIYDDVDWEPGPEHGGDDPNANTDPPGGDDVDPPGGGHDEEECGIIVASCQVILEPPVRQARELANRVDPSRFAPDLAGGQLDTYRGEFYRGLWAALSEGVVEAEVVPLHDDIRTFGLCEY